MHTAFASDSQCQHFIKQWLKVLPPNSRYRVSCHIINEVPRPQIVNPPNAEGQEAAHLRAGGNRSALHEK